MSTRNMQELVASLGSFLIDFYFFHIVSSRYVFSSGLELI